MQNPIASLNSVCTVLQNELHSYLGWSVPLNEYLLQGTCYCTFTGHIVHVLYTKHQKFTMASYLEFIVRPLKTFNLFLCKSNKNTSIQAAYQSIV